MIIKYINSNILKFFTLILIVLLYCIFIINFECRSCSCFCCNCCDLCFQKNKKANIQNQIVNYNQVEEDSKNKFSNVNNNDKNSCRICFDSISNQEKFYTCIQHYFCKSCVFCHIKESIKNTSMIKCPYDECESIISIESVFEMLNNNMLNDNVEENQNLIEKIKEYQYIHEVYRYPDIGLCMYEGCEGVVDTNKNDFEYFLCNKNVGHKHCKECYDIIHEGVCKQIDDEDLLNAIAYNKNIINEYRFREEEIMSANVPYGFVDHNHLKTPYTCGVKPCPNCGRLIFKDGGCNAVQCGSDFVSGSSKYNIGCGYVWCWRCGKNNQFYYVGTKWLNHYDDPNDECYGMRHQEQKNGHEKDFSDGDYFGIMNGNYVKHFKIYYKKLQKLKKRHN